MNRPTYIAPVLIAVLSLIACGDRETDAPTAAAVSGESVDTGTIDTESSGSEEGDRTRILIAYFSMPESDGTDAVAGASRVVVNGTVYGNTEWIARRIQDTTGGNLFAIETVREYPGNHDALVDRGDVERSTKARPELVNHVGNIDDYDVVFIGYPIWWYEFPMPVYSFLEEHDFSGKVLVPFSSHGDSGLADTISALADLQPNAVVLKNGLAVSRNEVIHSGEEIAEWLRGFDFQDTYTPQG